MKNKEKLRMEIRELHISGYTYERISEKTGVSISTISRVIRKSREESNHWLANIAKKDLANIFRESLEGLKQDMMYLNELLSDELVKKNPKLQLQIRREITHIRSEYLKNLLQGPVMWSMDALAKGFTEESIPQPVIESLGGISGVKN
ncbi:MAG: helix-turn-helix domain-containing protein [Nitrosopumilaceae archaeon]|nr:helix-turn-helix domain-containing protein [Nitrosopumilaceae archaeon]